MSAESLDLTWLPILGGLALKSLIVFLVAGLALLALRRASASARHLVCLLALAGLVALPLLSLGLPGWRLPVLAVPAASPMPAASPPVMSTAPALTGTGTQTKVIPFEPPSARLAPLLVLPPPAPAPRPFPWLSFLTALWLGGALLAGLRPLLGLWGIARLSQESAAVADAPILAQASECASALGLTRTPALRQADAPVPMTWGWRHPVVLLPDDAPGWPEGRLRAVLLHELAHIRRRDWLSHRFADLVCALYWFHPLAWLTARRLRTEGEIACDDLVLTSGIAAPDYARHLLDVARALRPIPDVPQAAIAMARTARIEGRLTMILDATRPRRALTRRALLLVLAPAAAALVTLAMLRLDARAQAAPASVAAAPAKLRRVFPLPASRTLVRYFFSSGPPYRLMKKQGRGNPIVWGKPQRADLPSAAPPQVNPRPKAVPPFSKPVSAASLPSAVRVAQLPRSTTPSMPLAAPAAPPTLSVTDLKVDGASLLAGVTDADKPGVPWWSAAGALLPDPVYDTAAYKAERHPSGRADRRLLLFAFRLPASSQDITVRYELPQSLGSSSDGSWPTKIAENAHRTEAQMFPRTNGSRVVTAEFPSSLSKTSIRVGLASGPWKLAASYAPTTTGFGNIDILQGNNRFLFSPVSETKGGTIQSIATDATDDLRVVVIDAQGKESLPLLVGDTSAGALDQITARFALPLAQIKEIRVETRPFRWVEFKDIALQPAK